MALFSMQRVFSLEVKKFGSILACAFKATKCQTANICSKETMDPNVKKPAPYPYETRQLYRFQGYIEGTLKRFDDNTKIIVVDGNIGCGKTAFAKHLADAFDMKYLPEPTIDPWYILPNGYDLRQIDDLLPYTFKCCDINTFYKNPHHHNVPMFQFKMYLFRLAQYIDALAHLLNTGQGIVMERSVYSDMVFVEAMFKAGYLSKKVYETYDITVQHTIDELLRPHLIVYLDVTPETCLKRIKERNNPNEVNSKVLNTTYLSDIEFAYKHLFLPEMEKQSEVLIYDWNHYGDMDVVVEDIERIDFDRFHDREDKLCDWRKEDDWEWFQWRYMYTREAQKIEGMAYIQNLDCEELWYDGNDVADFHALLDKIPGAQFQPGFNPKCGDNVWFKIYQKGAWADYRNNIIRYMSG